MCGNQKNLFVYIFYIHADYIAENNLCNDTFWYISAHPQHKLHVWQTTACYVSDTATLHLPMLDACGRTGRRSAHKCIWRHQYHISCGLYFQAKAQVFTLYYLKAMFWSNTLPTDICSSKYVRVGVMSVPNKLVHFQFSFLHLT